MAYALFYALFANGYGEVRFETAVEDLTKDGALDQVALGVDGIDMLYDVLLPEWSFSGVLDSVGHDYERTSIPIQIMPFLP